MADSMILELKPSSYNNLFERGKIDLDFKAIEKMKKQNLLKYP